MYKGLLFQKYRSCYIEARSRNTVLTDIEIRNKTFCLRLGCFIGLILGFLVIYFFYSNDLWSFQFLILVLCLCITISMSLYLFDFFKALKIFQDSKARNLKNIIRGDWRTLKMREEEQVNFRNNLIQRGLLKSEMEKNIPILDADLKYFLSLVDRKKMEFKDSVGASSKIIVFFMGGIWAIILKEGMNYTSFLNIVFLSLAFIVMIVFVKFYINRVVLDEPRECLIICDELTEIKNNIIRDL